MPAFTGTLRTNLAVGGLYNMIINLQTYAENVAHNYSHVDKARVDVGLYGDQRLYIATDALKTEPWGADAEATNLLKLHRPPQPRVQALIVSEFRQISVTTDEYLSKQAWLGLDSFSQFTSVVLGWIEDTRRIYENTLYNTFIGTAEGQTTAQTLEIDLSTISAGTTEEANRLYAQTVANALANLKTKLKDYSRAYNDYGFLRSYAKDDIKIIMNEEILNKITIVDLPTVFHSEKIQAQLSEDALPARYFGEVGTTDIAKANNDGTKRSMIEADYSTAASGAAVTHVFAGDLIPAGTARLTKDPATGVVSISAGIRAGEYYTQDEDVVAKVFVKYPPYLGAFITGTNFFNAKSLTQSHFLTFGHSKLEYLKNFPFITVHTDGSITVA